MMTIGIQELKKDLGRKQGLNELPEIHQFLDRCYMSRIGIRMLIGQHVALHDPNPPPGYVGLICTKVSPVIVPQNAIDDARSTCMRTYDTSPDFVQLIKDSIHLSSAVFQQEMYRWHFLVLSFSLRRSLALSSH